MLIFKHKPFPFFLDKVLFAISFVVMHVAGGVLKAPSKYGKFPHTVNILLCVSDLFGRISHTIRPHVTFFVEKGNYLLGINVKLFFPFILVPTP